MLRVYIIFLNQYLFGIFPLQMHRNTDLQEEKNRILGSFSSIEDPNLIDEALKFIQSVMFPAYLE